MKDELNEIIDQMKARRVEFAPGLSDKEINEIEQTCKFQFPADLRTFLQLGVPVTWTRHDQNGVRIHSDFPNWREDPLSIMNRSREWAGRAFYFDIEHSNFWMEKWGKRPQELSEAIAIAARYLQTVPLLIPIFGHRFLPAEPNLPGNPVLAVWQAQDTIYYGHNLQDYLRHEFMGIKPVSGQLSDYRDIPFWSDIVLNGYDYCSPPDPP